MTVTDGTTTKTVLGSRFRSTAYSTGNYLSFSTQQSAVTDNLTFSVDSIEMTGLTLPEPTTTMLASSGSPVDVGDLVMFTATVTSGTGVPQGTVTFFDDENILGTGVLDPAGVATLATAGLGSGIHAISASYAAIANFMASNSNPTDLTIRSATHISLASSASPAPIGEPVTFTAIVDSDGGTPGGTVSFLAGGVEIGTSILNGEGIANLTTTALAVGEHSITAAYGGGPTYSTSSSGLVAQSIFTAYDAWRAAHFSPAALDDPLQSGANADPDGDGYENLVEYTFGANPLNFTATGLPVVTRGINGHLSISFLRLREDINYFVEAGNTPATWTTLAMNPGSVGSTVVVEDDPPPGATTRFVRLRVVRDPGIVPPP